MFVEGLRTEEIYLVDWHRRYRDRVTVTVDPFRGGPLQLVKRAIEAQRIEKRETRRGRGRPYDQIWCMFDRDEHPNFVEALQLATDHGIHLAISNPCLELWFLLHFQDQTAFIDRHDAQQRAEMSLQCARTLTPAATEKLAEHYQRARERAIKLDEKHCGDGSTPGSNPSSGVWKVVEAIRSA